MTKPIFENEEDARKFLEVLNSHHSINDRIDCMDILRTKGYIKKDIIEEAKEKYVNYLYAVRFKDHKRCSFSSSQYLIDKDFFNEIDYLIQLQNKVIEHLTNK